MINRCLCLVMLCAVSTFAGAQRTGTVHGSGSTSCGEYLQDRARTSSTQDAIYWQWVFGFLSAYNLYSQERQLETLPGSATIVAYLDKSCRDNPLENVTQASMRLLADLGGYRPPWLKR